MEVKQVVLSPIGPYYPRQAMAAHQHPLETMLRIHML